MKVNLFRKMLQLFLIACVMHITQATAQDFYVRGDGEKKCAEFIDMRSRNDVFAQNIILQYLEGFINGAEIQRMWNKQGGINNATGEIVLSMAEAICMKKPQNNMLLTAAEIVRNLTNVK